MSVKTKKKSAQLTAAEQELLETGCLAMAEEIDRGLCPAFVLKNTPYTYQKYGCRGVACKEVNSEYYANAYDAKTRGEKAKSNGHKKTSRK